MRVVDANGRFVGFVREIVGQNLVIGRPAAADIEVPMATCQLGTETAQLNVPADEIDQDQTRR